MASCNENLLGLTQAKGLVLESAERYRIAIGRRVVVGVAVVVDIAKVSRGEGHGQAAPFPLYTTTTKQYIFQHITIVIGLPVL